MAGVIIERREQMKKLEAAGEPAPNDILGRIMSLKDEEGKPVADEVLVVREPDVLQADPLHCASRGVWFESREPDRNFPTETLQPHSKPTFRRLNHKSEFLTRSDHFWLALRGWYCFNLSIVKLRNGFPNFVLH